MHYLETMHGTKILVDEDIYELYKNKAMRMNNHGYAITNIRVNKKQVTKMLHSLIMNTPKGYEVDHINRNKLDNRRENLRVCTKSQNMCNGSNFKNKFLGVSFDKSKSRWTAEVTVKSENGVIKRRKRFKDEVEAAKWRDEQAKELHGEFAILNF